MLQVVDSCSLALPNTNAFRVVNPWIDKHFPELYITKLIRTADNGCCPLWN